VALGRRRPPHDHGLSSAATVDVSYTPPPSMSLARPGVLCLLCSACRSWWSGQSSTATTRVGGRRFCLKNSPTRTGRAQHVFCVHVHSMVRGCRRRAVWSGTRNYRVHMAISNSHRVPVFWKVIQ
jgi:hypothetical protein